MTESATKNLLDNQKFREFIDAFKEISEAAGQVSLAEGRKMCTQFFLSEGTVFEEVVRITDTEIVGKDQNAIPLRIYTPSQETNLPVLLYFHRGGWVFSNIEEADPVCRKLANQIGAIVISVEYRLCPENPFPKPLEDCYAAAEWASKNASQFGGDQNNIIVCGESCGGNLAGAVALMARDKKESFISSQVLIYPIITSSINEASYRESPDQYFITKDAMTFFWSVYCQAPEDRQNPYASLDLMGDLSNLPPAVIITAEYDPLHVEGEEYARKLQAAGVKVITHRFPELIHGFIDLPIYEENDKITWIKEIKRMMDTLY